MTIAHLDFETYGEQDITSVGAYRYIFDPSFRVLMAAVRLNDEAPILLDFTAPDESAPRELFKASPRRVSDIAELADLLSGADLVYAHNAQFERLVCQRIGIAVDMAKWRCTAVWASYAGLPMSLANVTKALGFGADTAKSAKGKSLIRFFSIPAKTANGLVRRMPEDNLAKWQEFCDYCVQDVVAECEVANRLSAYPLPDAEWALYLLDQVINDRGVMVDQAFCRNVVRLNERHGGELLRRSGELTNLTNPNSPSQLKGWLSTKLGRDVDSLTKADLSQLASDTEDGAVLEVLKIRAELGKTSVKKYEKMLGCAMADSRARGLLQFYGAGRTGRWAGRLIQVQNLPRNYVEPLEEVREDFKSEGYEFVQMMYGDKVGDLSSQLLRTALVAEGGGTFAVADFSAIEARVLSWLAGEAWRLEVFSTHGKIYEASAAMMFGVPIEEVTKGSDYRAKGKVAELALGYQGSVGALEAMGGAKMGLDEEQMRDIVDKWRAANPSIVALWSRYDDAAVRVVGGQRSSMRVGGVVFRRTADTLEVVLPSGRSLHYWEPSLAKNRWGKTSVRYKGKDQMTGKWANLSNYGGKYAENITQAVARDLIAYSLRRLEEEGYKTVMHIHDECVVELPQSCDTAYARTLSHICDLMGEAPKWAEGLPLTADGYLTPFYKKD